MNTYSSTMVILWDQRKLKVGPPEARLSNRGMYYFPDQDEVAVEHARVAWDSMKTPLRKKAGMPEAPVECTIELREDGFLYAVVAIRLPSHTNGKHAGDKTAVL